MSSSDYSKESDSEYLEDMLRNIGEEAQSITNNLLPVKSSSRYTTCYEEFMKWRTTNKVDSFTEDVFLVYFNELAKQLKPSTMWSRWSMIRSVININHGIDINNFQRLKTFMKNKSRGFQSKKAHIFTGCQITQFINEAKDEIYLLIKVVLIFGVCGALRSIEFCNLNLTDIEDTGSQYIVMIRDSKNYYPRSFVIGAKYYDRVKQYMILRPNDMNTNRFFIHYENGKCTRQVIGKNKISEFPKTIAFYLNLSNPERYTGHTFRRTSATLLANSGATLTMVKQHGGWKSSAVAEGYIEHSVGNKQRIFDQITNSEEPSTSITSNIGNRSSPVQISNLKQPIEFFEHSSTENLSLWIDNSSTEHCTFQKILEIEIESEIMENYKSNQPGKTLKLTNVLNSQTTLKPIGNNHFTEPLPKRLKISNNLENDSAQKKKIAAQ